MYEKEQKLVEGMYPEIVTMLKEITGFERGTKNLPGIRQMAAYMKQRMEALGCEVSELDDPEYGPTLVSRKKGRGKLRAMFYAHMDTVWPDGSTKELPFRIEGEYAYGAGVSDCSQGLIGSVFMLKALNELGFDNYDELIFVFNPDEELTSISSTKWLKKISSEENIDLAICMEGPDREGTFTSARAGSAYYEINIKGKMAHAGVNPEDGANALVELTYKMNDILAKQFPDVYLVVCWMRGGSGDCCVADNAYAMLRYRIKTWDVVPQIDAFLKEVEKKTYVPGTTTSIEFWPQGGFGPMPKLPWLDKFVEAVEETSAEMGYPLKESYSYGGCDGASTVTNCPTLDGLTPLTYGCHSKNERIKLTTIVPRIALLSVLIQKFCSDEKYLRKASQEG